MNVTEQAETQNYPSRCPAVTFLRYAFVCAGSLILPNNGRDTKAIRKLIRRWWWRRRWWMGQERKVSINPEIPLAMIRRNQKLQLQLIHFSDFPPTVQETPNEFSLSWVSRSLNIAQSVCSSATCNALRKKLFAQSLSITENWNRNSMTRRRCYST